MLTAYSKVTIQHNDLNKKNRIQNQKYMCKNNSKLSYYNLYSVHVNLKSINNLSSMKTMNKLSLIKSINIKYLSLVKTIIEISVINNIPPRSL